MISTRDVQTLAEFQAQTSESIARLKETGQPLTLTIDGRPACVVQDTASYQKMLDLIERYETREAVGRGLAEAKRGEGRPMGEFFTQLEADLRELGDS